MKRLLQVVVATAVAVVIPVAASIPASAAFKCEIGYTGPDSQNMCTSKEQFACTVQNKNEVTIKNSNDQEVASGDVSVDGNGNGGGAVSGSASNSNSATFNVVIDNGSGTPACFAKAVVPATETPEPGRGGSVPTQEAAPKALPVTSGSTAPVILLSVGGIAALAGIVALYRRLHI